MTSLKKLKNASPGHGIEPGPLGWMSGVVAPRPRDMILWGQYITVLLHCAMKWIALQFSHSEALY